MVLPCITTSKNVSGKPIVYGRLSSGSGVSSAIVPPVTRNSNGKTEKDVVKEAGKSPLGVQKRAKCVQLERPDPPPVGNRKNNEVRMAKLGCDGNRRYAMLVGARTE